MRISITRNDIEEKSEPGFTQKLEKITSWERKNGHRSQGSPDRQVLSLFQSDGFSLKPKNKDRKGNSGRRISGKRGRTVFNEMLRELKDVKRKLEEICVDILEDNLYNPFEMFYHDLENLERRFDRSFKGVQTRFST